MNATWFAWEGFSEEQLPHRHRSRGAVRALGATVVYGAQFSECPWHLHMLIAVFKGYDGSGCAKSYGHEKKRKVPALPRAYLLRNTRVKETSDDAGTHVSFGNSSWFCGLCVCSCVFHMVYYFGCGIFPFCICFISPWLRCSRASCLTNPPNTQSSSAVTLKR